MFPCVCRSACSWAGNYVPYRYNLELFVPVNSVLTEHMVRVLQSPRPVDAEAIVVVIPLTSRRMQECRFVPSESRIASL